MNSKTKLNIGSPDLEKASGIDNQGLLKAWMLLFQQKRKIIAENNKRNKAN
jgi:hypothetical protein